ncbi:hypothetical protein HNP84_006794 [Thermocatellispora tengchongensis]|uniref:Uncharacterized protein n=1 Tax=Thermocatellispora tengchongensis TaxID=1073253 RepID=A0A840PCT0_9ACTN|nr:hypothetical protein [Thermocatellispora tengchongensis]
MSLTRCEDTRGRAAAAIALAAQAGTTFHTAARQHRPNDRECPSHHAPCRIRHSPPATATQMAAGWGRGIASRYRP